MKIHRHIERFLRSPRLEIWTALDPQGVQAVLTNVLSAQRTRPFRLLLYGEGYDCTYEGEVTAERFNIVWTSIPLGLDERDIRRAILLEGTIRNDGDGSHIDVLTSRHVTMSETVPTIVVSAGLAAFICVAVGLSTTAIVLTVCAVGVIALASLVPRIPRLVIAERATLGLLDAIRAAEAEQISSTPVQ